jgi:uncharacterized protein YsxB (DUF464 family)
MITVKFTQSARTIRATTEGHADLNPGNDPVCAAVSALMYALKGSVENLMHSGKKNYRTEPGIFTVRYTADTDAAATTAAFIFNTILIGLLQIQATYPEQVHIVPKDNGAPKQ